MGTAVDVVVSLGPPATVPDIVGQSEADANTAISAAGLIIGTATYAYSDTVAAGYIISQNPTGGTEVPFGSSVDFVVSLGQAAIVPTVAVPCQPAS